jgi:Flp pilus assembly protein TadG
MRSLIRSRLRRDDAGATLLVVAIMMTVLLGMGALVIDVGKLYVERRELQNGADAGAFAVAQDCAKGACGPATSTAQTYANDNAGDHKAGIKEVCGAGPGLVACAVKPANAPANGWVKVTTTTPADNKVSFSFAPVFGRTSGARQATAVATWGGPTQGTTIPVTLSVCDFQALGGSIDGTTFPGSQGYIYTHTSSKAPKCDAKGNGQIVPGGFGWLDHDEATCKVTVANGIVDGDTGNNTECKNFWATWLGTDVLVPLYNAATGTGSGAQFTVVGFAALTLQGYCLGSNVEGHLTPKDAAGKPWPNCSNDRYLYGKFTHFVAVDGQAGGTNFGVTTVSMID